MGFIPYNAVLVVFTPFAYDGCQILQAINSYLHCQDGQLQIAALNVGNKVAVEPGRFSGLILWVCVGVVNVYTISTSKKHVLSAFVPRWIDFRQVLRYLAFTVHIRDLQLWAYFAVVCVVFALTFLLFLCHPVCFRIFPCFVKVVALLVSSCKSKQYGARIWSRAFHLLVLFWLVS